MSIRNGYSVAASPCFPILEEAYVLDPTSVFTKIKFAGMSGSNHGLRIDKEDDATLNSTNSIESAIPGLQYAALKYNQSPLIVTPQLEAGFSLNIVSINVRQSIAE